MTCDSDKKAKNFGFVSTRFAGTDGVSLESAKWAEIFWRNQHISYWFAGKLDRAREISLEYPEAFFDFPENRRINEQIFGKEQRNQTLTGQIHALRKKIKVGLYQFIEKYKIDVLIAQNCLTIPMHVSLGLALTEVIAETGIPTIAHHHDFFWERDRFAINGVPDYIQMAFPPKLPNIQHAVINSAAREQLAYREGISSFIIPNVIDFKKAPPPIDDFSASFKKDIGLAPDDILILQPTRLVARKGIEHAIELLRRINNPKYKLIISHEAGDEGQDYAKFLREYATSCGVDMRIVSNNIAEKRATDKKGNKKYTLWDVYPHADLVTYPSLYEGFGNAFLEAVYFKKPLLVNRYSIYIRDIEPKGFQAVVMNGYVTDKVVQETQRVVEDKEYQQKMVEHNFEVAQHYFSFEVLERRLCHIVSNIFGI